MRRASVPRWWCAYFEAPESEGFSQIARRDTLPIPGTTKDEPVNLTYIPFLKPEDIWKAQRSVPVDAAPWPTAWRTRPGQVGRVLDPGLQAQNRSPRGTAGTRRARGVGGRYTRLLRPRSANGRWLLGQRFEWAAAGFEQARSALAECRPP